MVILSRKKKGMGRGSSSITSERKQSKIKTKQEKRKARSQELGKLLTKEGKLLDSKKVKFNIKNYRNESLKKDEIDLIKALLKNPSPAGSSSPDSRIDSRSSQSGSTDSLLGLF